MVQDIDRSWGLDILEVWILVHVHHTWKSIYFIPRGKVLKKVDILHAYTLPGVLFGSEKK